MDTIPTLMINGREVAIENEPNILELCRRIGVDIPTFCYHSELSVYGACRLCLVDVEGRGIVASCSVRPEPGMVVLTHTEEIRQMRRVALELILANHDQNCPTCPQNMSCELQSLTRRLGVGEVRFKRTHAPMPVDRSSPSLVRDPNKCVLCGDCVRACDEIQSVGAIDFAKRGAAACVAPAFNKNLADVECVNCGLCATVCPTGALTPTDHVDDVWRDIENPARKVVAQIAPAVRVALGETFGLPPGDVETGRMIAALRALGFDAVYDTSFTADMTVLEEGTEFLHRKQEGGRLPQFTSCCPAWVKFTEQFYPDLMGNLSSCRSPQQMFGSVAKRILPDQLGVTRDNLVVVSIMPCTAKKFEARQSKFQTAGKPDVDHVLTTQELARMIQEAGLRFEQLEPDSFDMPFGFKTGAGVLFGATGGVTEAVLRYAVEKLRGVTLDAVDFHEVRGEARMREAELNVGDVTLRIAIVHGLAGARRLAQEVREGRSKYDLIEVMACPGGCVGGAGQPVARDGSAVRRQRTRGLYQIDKSLQLHKAQENHLLAKCYADHLGEVGSHTAHDLLHTEYQSRRRIAGMSLPVTDGEGEPRLRVSVCVGTSCFVRGAQRLLQDLVEQIRTRGLNTVVRVEATFCTENCDRGPTVTIGDRVITKCTLEKAARVLEEELAGLKT